MIIRSPVARRDSTKREPKPRTKLGYSFDAKNEAAQRFAERQAAAMVKEIGTATLDALRALVARSIREGIPPYDAARMIRSMVGMSTPQAQAAMNYREGLIESGLSFDRVNGLVDRYVERKIAERAESIARTEIMDALNSGQREAWDEAQKEGYLDADAKQEWIVTPDERLCPSCEPMDGVQVPLGENFQTPDGSSPGPPLHPQCRCAVAVVP